MPSAPRDAEFVLVEDINGQATGHVIYVGSEPIAGTIVASVGWGAKAERFEILSKLEDDLMRKPLGESDPDFTDLYLESPEAADALREKWSLLDEADGARAYRAAEPFSGKVVGFVTSADAASSVSVGLRVVLNGVPAPNDASVVVQITPDNREVYFELPVTLVDGDIFKVQAVNMTGSSRVLVCGLMLRRSQDEESLPSAPRAAETDSEMVPLDGLAGYARTAQSARNVAVIVERLGHQELVDKWTRKAEEYDRLALAEKGES